MKKAVDCELGFQPEENETIFFLQEKITNPIFGLVAIHCDIRNLLLLN